MRILRPFSESPGWGLQRNVGIIYSSGLFNKWAWDHTQRKKSWALLQWSWVHFPGIQLVLVWPWKVMCICARGICVCMYIGSVRRSAQRRKTMERHVRKGKGCVTGVWEASSLSAWGCAHMQPGFARSLYGTALHCSFLGHQPQLSFSQYFFGPLGRRNAEPCTAITTLARRKNKLKPNGNTSTQTFLRRNQQSCSPLPSPVTSVFLHLSLQLLYSCFYASPFDSQWKTRVIFSQICLIILCQ